MMVFFNNKVSSDETTPVGERLVPLITSASIAVRVSELAEQINEDYQDRPNFLVVGVLNGAAIFLADLIRQLSVPVIVDFLRISSYGASTESTGVVQIRKDIEISPTGRDVLVVEDIVDTGLTVSYLMKHLAASEPRSIEVCTLLDKPDRRQVEFTPRYVGFQIPNHFVVGYGLDYQERHRQLPGIAIVSFDEE